MATSVNPDYIEIKNTGDENLGELEITLTVDCSTKQLTALIENEDEEPIADADTYLFYTNYGYQLLTTASTGDDGTSTMNVMGNINYLTAMFVFRADADGYQSQEIEFTYEKCEGYEQDDETEDSEADDEDQIEQDQDDTNQTEEDDAQQANQTNNQQNQSNTAQQNQTINQTGQNHQNELPSLCPVGMIFMALLLMLRKVEQ
jgi:DNA segregation ATPase FtsK/SpoIIIE-like protein